MNETLERLPPLVFMVLFATLWLWEAVATARPSGGDGLRRRRNLTVSLLNFLLGGLAAAAMLAASAWIATTGRGLTAWPGSAFAVIAGVLLLDMTDYWRHRVSHKWPLLWRLHRVHHTDPRIDLTTALRGHPIEQLMRPLFVVGAVVVFGIPRLAVLIYPLLGLPVLLFQHANVRLPAPLDRALVWLISTPSMHLVHHSRRTVETDSNYATGLTLWDRLFGTYSSSPLPHGIGLDGFDHPGHQTIRGMLHTPWEAAEQIATGK